MLIFTLKKWLFDMWDVVIRLLIINALSIVALAITLTIPGVLTNAGIDPFITIPVFFTGIFLMILLISGITAVTSVSVYYKKWNFSDFWNGAKKHFLSTFFFIILNAAAFFLLSNAVPFYLELNDMLGFAAVAVLLWVGVFWMMAALFYIPLSSQMQDPFIKTLKKSFLVALDNPGFAVVLLALVFLSVIASGFTAFMFPGVFGILLLLQGATKLRLRKYDYIEENSDADRKNIPWNALLDDDSQYIGKISLKNTFFPWKE